MELLLLKTFLYNHNRCHNLHSNMELLLRVVHLMVLCSNIIYIPIWSYCYNKKFEAKYKNVVNLHSNMELLLHTPATSIAFTVPSFTFQYGATATSPLMLIEIITSVFTFQYGATAT